MPFDEIEIKWKVRKGNIVKLFGVRTNLIPLNFQDYSKTMTRSRCGMIIYCQ